MSTIDTSLVDLTAEISYHSLLSDRFIAVVVAEDLWHVRGFNWETEATELFSGDVLLASVVYGFDGARENIIRLDDGVAWVRLSHGRVNCRIGVSDPADLESARERVSAALPLAPPSGDVATRIEFWNWTSEGPESSSRQLKVTTWADVRDSYAFETQVGVDALMDGFTPGQGGRLLLWHGAPGTGKTTALRALAWEWRDWCDVHYITDPETFFGREPGYMLRLLTQSSNDRWRLLVLEDTGELMRQDAKDQSGQGLSRLLNLVDGLIGQGFPVLVLVTTNEPMAALHEAVARPGRCTADVEFLPLPQEKATAWLQARGCERSPVGEATLAECYATLAGHDPPVRRPIGFGT